MGASKVLGAQIAGLSLFLTNATPQETSVSEDLHFVCESKLLHKAVCLQTAAKISHTILVANFKRCLKQPSYLLQSLARAYFAALA